MELVIYPSPLLRKKSMEISNIDEKFIDFLKDDFFNYMIEKDGIGLAAIQVGIEKRFFVMQTPIDENQYERKIVINPKILKFSKETISYEEGCLSIPNVYARVIRPSAIEVEYINENNEKIQEILSGLEARVFQHEFDHLNGILFIDRLSQVELVKIKGLLKDLKEQYKKNAK